MSTKRGDKVLNIEWLGKVWFQSTEWQRSLNGKLRAQRLACILFEIGELKEISCGKDSHILRLPDTLLLPESRARENTQ